ncbi:crosslink repair DNA glycosylase YcaQ family protein [Nonomuraea sp. NPDC047529]|uniref:winged helix-turn-helix domain-containing protein n=1 Tax=Nonomuraea sp. NPDC047529 TaxID=3155623 RepID=UPI0033E7F9B0
MPNRGLHLSRAQARELAVAGQGLAGDAAFIQPLDVLSHLGAIQLDAIQRVDKAHRLVCLARAPHLQGRDAIDAQLWSPAGPATVFESAAHAVCLLPMTDWPLWTFMRERTARVSWAPEPALCDRVRQMVEVHGPVTLSDIEALGERKSSGWGWSDAKRAAEYLVWTGVLIAAARRGAKRVYDLAECRVPADLLHARPDEHDSLIALLDKAARVYGVATTADLTEYFRLPRAAAAQALTDTSLLPATVEGWDEPAWVHPATLERAPVPAEPVFLTPFDNLIWDRDRTRRLFSFDYTFEAYKPPAKRRFGYYVTPLLAGTRMIGRADLMRDGAVLRTLVMHHEPGPAPDHDLVLQAGQRLAKQLGCDEFRFDHSP